MVSEMAAESAAGDNRTITVRVAFKGQSEGQALPATRAYLFDRSGRLIQSQLAGVDPVHFDVAADQAYRVTVGPDFPLKGKDAPPNLTTQLGKANALSQDFVPQGPDSSVVVVNPNLWICWFPTCINVHGTVSKQSTNGSVSPICAGTVQIFQVDLGCTLDSFTVIDLRYLRARLIEKLNGSSSVVSQVANQQLASSKKLQRRNLATQTGSMTTTLGSARSGASSVSLSDAAATLGALEGTALKQFIIANRFILFPFWCELIPDYLFCWQELTEVPIQSDATFSAEICFWCPADFPDLYFEVVQNINGVDTEIYDPQIACSTYYDYDGTQSVDITVTDPRAIACLSTTGPGPNSLYVWPTAIGNEPLNGIDGLETLVGTGLLPGSTGPRPFGGTLSLQMLFHPDLRANNIMYYRWSYQFDGDPNPPKVINAPVTHRFQTSFIPPFFVDAYPLGPKTVGPNSNLFEIPDPNVLWVDIVDPLDRPYAYFDTTEGAPPTRSGVNTASCSGTTARTGMCTLILEIFDSGGNFVPCNNVFGPSTLDDQPGPQPPPGNFGFIFPQVGGPPNAFDFAPTPNITDQGRLIFRIFVDNNVCTAEIPKVATPVSSTDTDPCGILQYNNASDNVAISYVAFHPNNFLDWRLTVSLGISGIVAEIPPSPPPTNTSSGPLAVPAAFNNTAGALLTPPVGPPCTQGAFAVVLYAAARATDGYDTLTQYDCQAAAAFALTQPCPPCPTRLG
jgi:hypothetical protein